jgi:hypothetical protein
MLSRTKNNGSQQKMEDHGFVINRRNKMGNKKLDEARAARLSFEKKIAQIHKLVTYANFDAPEIERFIEAVLPSAYTETIREYIKNEPKTDVTSLFVDILCLAIEDTGKPTIHT